MFLYTLVLTLSCLLFPARFHAAMPANFGGDLHYERLQFLSSKGFQPKCIYDIGAYKGYWSAKMKRIFPQSQFFLFEANQANESTLLNQPFPYFIALLGDSDKTVSFYANDFTGDSVFQEQTSYYQNDRYRKEELSMTTLASLVEKEQIPLPDLVKIDVQGAEQLVIMGGLEIISHAEAVILETKILEYNKDAPLMHEIVALMASLDFRMLDILECHYLPTGELNEIDILFVKKESPLIKTGILF